MRNKYVFKLCYAFCFCLFVFCLCSCTGALKAKKLEEAISYDNVSVVLDDYPPFTVHFDYTGCSGFLIKFGKEAVLHDPFFSNVGPLLSLNTKKISSDTGSIQSFFDARFLNGKDRDGLIKLMLVSHTHYDHMLDVPYIYNNIIDKDQLLLLGSNDMIKVMNYGNEENVPSDKIISVEHSLTTANAVGVSYLSLNRKVRVWPIYTEHAPHYYGMHFFKGNIKKEPKKATHWREGANIAYLVDFLDNQENIMFRTYLTAAAANEPAGFIPSELLNQHPVDVAVLCVASYAYVKDYPEKLLENLNPRHIILSHWENFFQPLSELKEKPMVVPFTDVKKFLERVGEIADKLPNKPSWTMPNPGTQVSVHFTDY